MSTIAPVETVLDLLRVGAGVESVYGEPVRVGERTIIPVARVAYGFGGGGGSPGDQPDERVTVEPVDEGESDVMARFGGGGGVTATPVGVVEITPDGTRFVQFAARGRLVVALAVGLLVGVALGRR